jgi:transcriptional regulator with XRE-family HTH domain
MEILTLGKKIRKKRKSLHLTLKDVAGDNITPAQLSYVESDKCKPSDNLLKYICEKIDLDMDYALESEAEQVERQCEYYLQEYDILAKRGDVKGAQSMLRQIEELAAKYGLERYTAIAAYKRGIECMIKKDLDLPGNNYLRALHIFMKLDDMEYMAKCCNELSVLELKRGYGEIAREYLLFASECSLNLGHSRENKLINGEINNIEENQNVKHDNYKDGTSLIESAVHSWQFDALSIFEGCSEGGDRGEDYIEYLSQNADRLSSLYFNPLSIGEI